LSGESEEHPRDTAVGDEFDRMVRQEAEAMVRYALGSGLVVPDYALEALVDSQAGTFRSLAKAHDDLVRVVEPATPRGILLLEAEKPKNAVARVLGPTVLIRQLVVVALTFLVAFVALAVSTDAASTSDPALKTSGLSALWDILYLLSAAGLGAAFAALFRGTREVKAATLEQRAEASYWALVVLGLIAGLLLAIVIPIPGDKGLTKPLLALLGGFSARAVYQILERLVDAVVSLFGDAPAEDPEKLRRDAAAQAALDARETRVELAARLARLHAEGGADADASAIRKRVAELVDELLGPHTADK
jgi:hypothetical protein